MLNSAAYKTINCDSLIADLLVPLVTLTVILLPDLDRTVFILTVTLLPELIRSHVAVAMHFRDAARATCHVRVGASKAGRHVTGTPSPAIGFLRTS